MSVCSLTLRERDAPAGDRTKEAAGIRLGTCLGDVCVVYRQENEQGITLKITTRRIFSWKQRRGSRLGEYATDLAARRRVDPYYIKR